MAQEAMQLCDPGTVAGISAARESVELYLKNILAEIGQLQESEQFLANVDEVQTRSKDLDTWKVQREQLSAVETCAKTCTCDDGSISVVQEYNTLAQQAEKGSGLVAVPLPLSMELWPAVIIIFSAFGGFVLAAYLNHKKSRPEPMVCPLKGDCAAVIKSKYSTFLGVGVEQIGIVYYLAIALAYGVFLVWPAAITPTVSFLVLGVSTSAFLFSLYLTFIQIGFLREICTWCLLSALLSTVIFFASVMASDFSFVPLLSTWRPLISFLALLGLILGVCGATFGDIFFLQFLKDLKISEQESNVLQTISQITWLGLGVLVTSGIAYYLSNFTALSRTGSFLVLTGIVGVTIVTSAFLNLKTMPRLVQISFGDDPDKNPEEELQSQRKLAFALSAISLVSWYSVLVLSIVPLANLSLMTLAGTYGVLLIVGLVVSQIFERHYARQPMAR